MAFVLAAAWHDVKERRIPNNIVFLGAAAGLLLNAVLPGGLGFLKALGGLGAGLAAFLPIYLLRAMGAGDVKLMAMIGAFLGYPSIIGAIMGTLLAGGVLGLWHAYRLGVLRQMFRNIQVIFFFGASKLASGSLPTMDDAPPPAGHFPYGVAIALGTAVYLLAQYIGWDRYLY